MTTLTLNDVMGSSLNDLDGLSPEEAAEVIGLAVRSHTDDLLSTHATTPFTFAPEAVAPSLLPTVTVTYRMPSAKWELMANCEFQRTMLAEIDGVPDFTTLTAREGYTFDLATVPRAFWSIIAPNELSLIAPLFHDLLYHVEGRLPGDKIDATPYPITFIRKEADRLFFHLMRTDGVAEWKCKVAYLAVRTFGGLFWQ